MKQDITIHSDNELSLIVFNDEYLYNLRRNERVLIEALSEFFIFNDAQLQTLKDDLQDDV